MTHQPPLSERDFIPVVLDAIERNEDRTVAWLQKMVAFRSVNPPGNEAECSRWIAARLADMGLRVEMVEAVPDRPNVLAWLDGEGDGRTLLFYGGHVDVVPEGDRSLWKVDPFGGEIQDGWIYGRGTADHKGSIAASLAALEAILAAGIKLQGDLLYLVAVDEESGGMQGTKHLVDNGYLRGDFGIYAGPGNPSEIVLASKGLLQMRLTVKGKGGHAATPWAVANPIEQASRLILALQHMPLNQRSAHFAYPFGEGPGAGGTLSVTMIQAGDRINQIPAQCEFHLDRRLLPEESVDEAISQIQALLDDLNDEHPGFEMKISQVLASGDGVAISKDEAIVHILSRACEFLGVSPKTAATFATSDTRFLVNQARIPTAAYGAGLRGPDGAICVHGPNECLRLQELLFITKVYALAILDACGVA